MGYDIYAEIEADDKDRIEAIRKGQYRSLSIDNIYSRLKLLSGGLPYNDKEAKTAHRKIVHECGNYNDLINRELELLNNLGMNIPGVIIDSLPTFSFFMQFKFSLAKPYLSKDDDDFYICENSIRKDKVFKIPIVGSGSWKGNLRWTATLVSGAYPDTITRLFGSKKEEANKCKISSNPASHSDSFRPPVQN